MQFDKSVWDPMSMDAKQKENKMRPSLTYWQDVWRRFKKNKAAIISAIFLILLIVSMIVIPLVWKYSYSSQNLSARNQWSSWDHPFGTDKLGRDIFVRVLYGARISLSVGFVASLINLLVGVLYGGIAGFYGGKVDNIMMRIVDILYTIPLMLYVILLMVYLGKGMGPILLAIGLVYWIGMARVVRGQFFSLKTQEYVMAAKALGVKDRQIMIRHLVPNAMGPIIVLLTMSIPSAIFTEAFLSYIGLGVSAPMASWGVLCNDALTNYTLYPQNLLFPALALCLTMLAFNFLGDGLRDALDPKMRK
ncbi:ABC transporter permease [Guggenheimella bovis]